MYYTFLYYQIDKNRIDASGMIEETAGDEIINTSAESSSQKATTSSENSKLAKMARKKPKVE